MTEREKFEAWFLDNKGMPRLLDFEYGQYANKSVDDMWQAWQARADIDYDVSPYFLLFVVFVIAFIAWVLR